MKPNRVAGLAGTQLARSTWYRATVGSHAPLEFRHTSKATTRFGSPHSRYFVLYFAAHPETALLEVEAVVATHNPPQTHNIQPSVVSLTHS